MVRRIPVAAITDAHAHRDALGCALTVSYTDRAGLLRALRFAPRDARSWQRAFQRIGVPLSGQAL